MYKNHMVTTKINWSKECAEPDDLHLIAEPLMGTERTDPKSCPLTSKFMR